jgi:hypothetical protein
MDLFAATAYPRSMARRRQPQIDPDDDIEDIGLDDEHAQWMCAMMTRPKRRSNPALLKFFEDWFWGRGEELLP